MDSGVRHQVTGGSEGARDQFYPLTIGMEEVTKNSKLLKGTSVGPWKVCFFQSILRGSSLKGTVMR